MKRAIVFLLILAAIIASTFADASACSCELPQWNVPLKQQVGEAWQKSRAVFSGRVLEILTNPDTFYVVVKLRVEKTWKGALTEEVSIVTGRGGGDCGFRFTVGEIYLVYAYGSDKSQLATNICQRTATIKEAAEDVKILGGGKAPSKARA